MRHSLVVAHTRSCLCGKRLSGIQTDKANLLFVIKSVLSVVDSVFLNMFTAMYDVCLQKADNKTDDSIFLE